MPADTSVGPNNRSEFTHNADIAFDEFCRKYFNSANGFFVSSMRKSTRKFGNPSKPPHVKDIFNIEKSTSGAVINNNNNSNVNNNNKTIPNGDLVTNKNNSNNNNISNNNNTNNLSNNNTSNQVVSENKELNKTKSNYTSEFSYAYIVDTDSTSSNNKQPEPFLSSLNDFSNFYKYIEPPKPNDQQSLSSKKSNEFGAHNDYNGYNGYYDNYYDNKYNDHNNTNTNNNNKKNHSNEHNNNNNYHHQHNNNNHVTNGHSGYNYSNHNNYTDYNYFDHFNTNTNANNNNVNHNNNNSNHNHNHHHKHNHNNHHYNHDNYHNNNNNNQNNSQKHQNHQYNNNHYDYYDYNKDYNKHNNGSNNDKYQNTNTNTNQQHNHHNNLNNYENKNHNTSNHHYNYDNNNNNNNNEIKNNSNDHHHQHHNSIRPNEYKHHNSFGNDNNKHHNYQNGHDDNGHHKTNNKKSHEYRQNHQNGHHNNYHNEHKHHNNHQYNNHNANDHGTTSSNNHKSSNFLNNFKDEIKHYHHNETKEIIDENHVVAPKVSSSKFKNEFLSAKKLSLDKENDVDVNYAVTATNTNDPLIPMKSSVNNFGLKVVACGMRKDARLPIPKANYFIDKGNFGDDAGFWSENDNSIAIGLADGATGNIMLGYDPGDFPRYLMKLCSTLFVESNLYNDPKTLLMKAFDLLQDKTCYGSCTACILTFDKEQKQLNIANIGDSGYRLLRDGKIIRKSEPLRISHDCPRQLDSYPWKAESRKMGVSYTEILGSETVSDSVKVKKDDVVILSSDGLYDNLEDDEIEDIFNKSKSVADAAEKMVTHSIRYNKKPDDILIIIGKIVETNKATTRYSVYSKEAK